MRGSGFVDFGCGESARGVDVNRCPFSSNVFQAGGMRLLSGPPRVGIRTALQVSCLADDQTVGSEVICA